MDTEYIEHTKRCKKCNNTEKKKALHKDVVEIGRPVLIETSIGRGTDATEHAFYQCQKCGTIWMALTDSGAGGHGHFLRRLTEGYF